MRSEVAGRAQILIVPDLEAGNMLAKNLALLARADSAGIVLGARVPIILTSRAGSKHSRMAPYAAVAIYADARQSAAPSSETRGRRASRLAVVCSFFSAAEVGSDVAATTSSGRVSRDAAGKGSACWQANGPPLPVRWIAQQCARL
jgi:hypothetical protein